MHISTRMRTSWGPIVKWIPFQYKFAFIFTIGSTYLNDKISPVRDWCSTAPNFLRSSNSHDRKKHTSDISFQCGYLLVVEAPGGRRWPPTKWHRPPTQSNTTTLAAPVEFPGTDWGGD